MKYTFAAVALVAGLALGATLPERGQEIDPHDNECILVSSYETVLLYPEYGEDDGMLYCPTGDVWSSIP